MLILTFICRQELIVGCGAGCSVTGRAGKVRAVNWLLQQGCIPAASSRTGPATIQVTDGLSHFLFCESVLCACVGACVLPV